MKKIQLASSYTLQLMRLIQHNEIFVSKMAAHTCAAALSSLLQCFIVCFLLCSVFFSSKLCRAKLSYSRLDLIRFGLTCTIPVTRNYQHSHDITSDIARTPGSMWIVGGTNKRRRQQRDRQQKRGCRVGLLSSLIVEVH